MKSICVVFALLLAAVTAIPISQNEEVGEEFAPEPVVDDNREDWQLVPDAEGYLHLVDINSFDMDVEPFFNANTDVNVRLWTRQNTGTGQIIVNGNNAQLAASNFVASRTCTRFHVHGWNGGGATTGASIRSALLVHADCNVFVIDWGAGAQTPNYITARNRVNPTGAFVASYMNWLNTQGVAWGNMGCIGHSLGAHVCGAAGKRTNQLISSVVGLDPAGPLFSIDVPADRIHHTDAVYTECQITDANRLGLEHPACNANFYPNWGTSQPGCGIDLTGNCGHGRVNDLMASSIAPANLFTSTRCGGIANIRNRSCPPTGVGRRMGGEPVNDGETGVGSVFFLPTSGTHPFSQG